LKVQIQNVSITAISDSWYVFYADISVNETHYRFEKTLNPLVYKEELRMAVSRAVHAYSSRECKLAIEEALKPFE
jgi:non-canonical (house-cleaning) NTP pyrophosphatase